MRGSLATDSGPSPTRWSTLDKQLVHVGENVAFSFVLTRDVHQQVPLDPFGVADYCTATLGSKRVEASLDDGGHYRFTFVIDEAQPGETLTVSAAAYRQKGQRDMIDIGGQWVRGENPYDPPDQAVGRDSLRLLVYRSRIDLPIERPEADLNLADGRLDIHKNDGSITSIYHQQNGRRGFHFEGPDADGRYHVFYDPAVDEINKSATTPIRFIVHDQSGSQHAFEAALATP